MLDSAAMPDEIAGAGRRAEERACAGPRLVLASASPRRAAILAELGADFVVRPADAEEPRLADPVASVRAAALAKHAAAVREAAPDEAVLAADTLVALDGEAIGKPRDRADAVAMLLRLSGREHLVHTAVAASAPGRGATPDVFVETSAVRFRALSRAEAEAYLDEARTLDRAGAYDIATRGTRVVESFTGSFTNVMGLPAERVGAWLAANGIYASSSSVPSASRKSSSRKAATGTCPGSRPGKSRRKYPRPR